MEFLGLKTKNITYQQVFGMSWDSKTRGESEIARRVSGVWSCTCADFLVLMNKIPGAQFVNDLKVYQTSAQWRIKLNGSSKVPDDCVMQRAVENTIYNTVMIPAFVQVLVNGEMKTLVGVIGTSDVQDAILFGVRPDDPWLEAHPIAVVSVLDVGGQSESTMMPGYSRSSVLRKPPEEDPVDARVQGERKVQVFNTYKEFQDSEVAGLYPTLFELAESFRDLEGCEPDALYHQQIRAIESAFEKYYEQEGESKVFFDLWAKFPPNYIPRAIHPMVKASTIWDRKGTRENGELMAIKTRRDTLGKRKKLDREVESGITFDEIDGKRMINLNHLLVQYEQEQANKQEPVIPVFRRIGEEAT